MARSTIFWLALFLMASYASATTIEEFCKGTVDAKYCVNLLKPTVSKSTNFKSEAWRHRALNRALVKALLAEKFMIEQGNKVKKSEVSDLRTCVNKLDNSVKLIKQGDFDGAAASQEACYDLLEDATGIMNDVRQRADEAALTSRVVNDILAKA